MNGDAANRRETVGIITSRAHTLARLARATRDGKESEYIFIEGVRLCEEAARSDLMIEHALHGEELLHDGRGARLIEEMARSGARVAVVSEGVLSSLSDTKTPQGVVALARRPAAGREMLERRGESQTLVVILHRVNNPSNAGAMLRVAESAGATGVIVTAGSTDVFSPKALRGSMGSAFRVPVWAGAKFVEAMGWCAERGIKTVGTDLRAARSHLEIDWTVARAVVVGPEAGGLSESEAGATDELIRIPMRPPVESLNVATALAVVLYEAARQRGLS